MREAAVIVESAVDISQLARSIAKEHIALKDCDRALDVAERKSEGLREQQRRHRVELGRLLIEAKDGIKHGGWLPYLEKLGINDQSARDWMRLAGHVEESKSKPNGDGLDLPTRREVNEARKPQRKSARPDEQPDPPPREPAPPALDIDRELSRIQDKLCSAAASMPTSVRKQIAHELRETARIIEEMS